MKFEVANTGPAVGSRLIGAAFSPKPPLAWMSYLAMDRLTVLFGPNGSGKSTALKELASQLPHGLQSPTSPSFAEDRWNPAALYFEVDGDQADTAFEAIAATLAGEPSPFPLRGDLIIEALRSSRIIAVNQEPTEGMPQAYWCLPGPLARYGGKLGAAIKSIQPADDERFEHAHLLCPEAPVAAVPISCDSAELVPLAVALPQDHRQIERLLRHSVAQLLWAVRAATELDWEFVPIEPIDKVRERPERPGDIVSTAPRDSRLWLQEDEQDGSVRIHPLAQDVLGIAETEINRSLPEFVSREVVVLLDLSSIAEWKDEAGFRVALKRDSASASTQVSSDDEYEGRFTLEQAAAGHQLWIQLAIMEAARTITAAAKGAPGVDVVSGTKRVRPKDPVHVVAEAFAAAPADPPPRLYIMDEPERHLHPALARQAARWLHELSRQAATQVLIATHSPLFLRLAGDVAWNRIDLNDKSIRPAESHYPRPRWRTSRITSFVPHEVDAFSAFADAMGFDRGELLTNLELILFVEGEADREVLDGLFAPELHSAGVAVIPIHGAVRAESKGIAETETLFRFISVKAGLLLDNLDRTDAQRLVHDAAYREEAAKSSATELRAMARLVDRAIETEISVQPLTIPVVDILDLLDEEIIKEYFPTFPGHETARSQAGKARMGWKKFYAERYGLDLLKRPRVFREVASGMRTRQTPLNPKLVTLRDDILSAARGEPR